MTEGWTYLLRTMEDVPRGLLDGISLSLMDLSAPRVSVFCQGNLMRVNGEDPEYSHGSDPWLFGSLEPNYGWLERTGELRWAVVLKYPTGDGYSVSLGRGPVQYLVGDRRLDESKLDRGEHDAELRARDVFKCGNCELSRVWRGESLHDAGNFLAGTGTKEVSLLGLDRVLSALKRITKA